MANPSLVAGLGAATMASGVGIAVGTSSKTPWFMSMFDSSEVTYKYQQFPCAGKLFKKVDWKAPANDGNAEDLKKISLKSSGVSGCISVRWERTSGNGSNWKGNWNVLWGMRDDTYGTIFVSTLVSGHKKTVDGLFYVLKKENGVDNWKVIGKRAVGKQDISSLEDNLIIKPGNTLDKSKHGWCFVKGLDSDAGCSKNKAQLIWNYKTGKLESVSDSELPANSWSENADNWIGEGGQFGVDFKDIYKDTKGYFSPGTN